MDETFILEAVRTPLGRRDRSLSEVHPVTLLGAAQRAAVERAGCDPGSIDQAIGGCVTQVGEQGFNVTRTAWLAAGLPDTVAASTVDAQCGSSQQAFTLAAGLIGSGLAELTVACGVESMSRIPVGSNYSKSLGLGRPITSDYLDRYEFLNQYQAAERIAGQWDISREAADEFGLLSQQRAAAAWDAGHFEGQIVALDGLGVELDRDEGLRETSLEALAGLKPVVPDGIHTAGTASQVSDGAGAVVLASRTAVERLGAQPLARVVDSMTVGVDPVTMLLGPHKVTPPLLARNQIELKDVDLVEINEAFASIALSWMKELDADPDRVNPNGGAIAIGHPLGATGGVLITKAVHELQRTGGRYGLVTMCCGGGLGTGTLLERT